MCCCFVCFVVFVVAVLLFLFSCVVVVYLFVFESQNGLGPLAVGSRRSGNRVGKKIKWGVEREDLKSLWSVRANEVIVNGTQDEGE